MTSIKQFVSISVYIFFVFSLIIISCADKEYKKVGYTIPGIETRISRVLISRNSFEGATIKILGKVKELEIPHDKTKSQVTTFKITDYNGNYINVETDKPIDFNNDDVIIMSGIYSSPDNTLNLIEYEIVKLTTK